MDGKSKDEVKALLGTNGLSYEDDKKLYYIGGFNIIDPWILDITFDENGKVKEYIIIDG